MSHPFRIYRILCSTPPDLEEERLAFETALAAFSEQVTFPQKVLFAGASFRPPFDATRHRASAEANVRMVDFFVHIFSTTWRGGEFPAFIDLAQACIAESARPMRQIAVLFKNYGGAAQEVRSYRDTLSARPPCDIRDFQDPVELDRVLREIFSSWWECVQATP
jgi:hypothetical protein